MNDGRARTYTVQGLTLIEVLVGVAIMVMVFTTLVTSFVAMLHLAERNRLRADALFLANEHIEMIRALPYDNVGTVAGLPSGTIPQSEVIIYDNHTFTKRTFIQYVDDPADGTDAGDTLAADYKRIKVEFSYEYQGETQSFSMVTTVAPRSQESLIGAGVLRINVTDALNASLPIATVHVFNDTVATTVDITTFTNASGTVSFPGAWAGAGYEVHVSKSGYSSAQTYTATTTNPNPSPSPYTVGENSTTEVYFKIDLLSTINLFARSMPIRSKQADTFDDALGLASQTNTQVAGGALTLAGAPGTYAPNGTATAFSITPGSLEEWLMFNAEAGIPANTALRYTIEYDTGGGVFAPVPDVDLPGNAAGFTATPVDLGVLDPTVYTSLRVTAEFDSSDPLVTPEVYAWHISYHEQDSPLPGVSVQLQGLKTIGTDDGGAPIYKYDEDRITDAQGRISLNDMEFDEYTVTPVGYALAEACPRLPLVLDPDTDYEQTLTLVGASANALKVTVLKPATGIVPRAEVRVEGGAIDSTRATGPCGIVYFPNLPEDTYTVTVQADGYAATTTDIAVSGLTTRNITMEL